MAACFQSYVVPLRYTIEQYDKNGFLKVPTLVWLGWMFLARSWVVFATAGASRQTGSDILAIVYPSTHTLYLGLVMGIPSMLLMWLIGFRSPERKWVNLLTHYGRAVTLILCSIQLAQTLYHIYLSHGAFSWANAVTAVLLSWFMIYLINARVVRDCFAIPEELPETSINETPDNKPKSMN